MGRLFNGKPVYTMACYYLDGLLIDTGPSIVADEIEDAFRDYPVMQIVNTHHHEDHTGNNIVFQDKLGLGPALAHELALPRIITPSIWTDRLRAYQIFAWGLPPASMAALIGSQIHTPCFNLKVINTPGHCDDHICLLEPDRGWLFSGDLFIGEKVSALRSDENVIEMLKSLRLLLDYDFETIFCSSGKVVEKGHEAIMTKIEYWESKGEEINKLYQQGKSTDEIRETVFGRETALYEPSEGDFGKINLVRSFLGL